MPFKIVAKACAHCRREFLGKTNKVYCSIQCRELASSRRKGHRHWDDYAERPEKCKRGHYQTPDNVRIRLQSNGYVHRSCILCDRAKHRKSDTAAVIRGRDRYRYDEDRAWLELKWREHSKAFENLREAGLCIIKPRALFSPTYRIISPSGSYFECESDYDN